MKLFYSMAALSALLFTASPMLAQQPDPGTGPDAPVSMDPTANAGNSGAEAPPSDTAPEASVMPGGEEPEGAAPIPQAYAIERYQASWDKNPFLLKTTPIAQPTVNWGQDWTLAGMSSFNGKIRVSIRNKQTNEFKRISNDEKPGEEFRLVRTHFSRNRKDALAVIAKGNQEAELKYDENAAPVTINNTTRAPSGANAAAPGAPGNPGLPQPGRAAAPNTTSLPRGPSPGLPGAQPTSPVPSQPGLIQPNLPGAQPAAPAAPTISRRRQLIPAPVITPPANP